MKNFDRRDLDYGVPDYLDFNVGLLTQPVKRFNDKLPRIPGSIWFTD
jgi:hypothetical protein